MQPALIIGCFFAFPGGLGSPNLLLSQRGLPRLPDLVDELGFLTERPHLHFVVLSCWRPGFCHPSLVNGVIIFGVVVVVVTMVMAVVMMLVIVVAAVPII